MSCQKGDSKRRKRCVLLGQLLENDEPLLDDLDLLGAADELILLNEDLVVAGTVKVIGTVEVVEVVQGLVSTPVVEGVVTALGYRRSVLLVQCVRDGAMRTYQWRQGPCSWERHKRQPPTRRCR